jgi:SAM-dependent methyltransferase
LAEEGIGANSWYSGKHAMWRRLARRLADSFLLRRGARLWRANQQDWSLPLSKWDKVLSGAYVILNDYAEGELRLAFPDRGATYAGEVGFRRALPGVDLNETAQVEMRKPFWYGRPGRRYLQQFSELCRAFERLGVAPPQRLLELGCGTGWMAEFMALMGFHVVGTTIAPDDVADAARRAESLGVKRLPVQLQVLPAAMESVHQSVGSLGPFDAVYVYEALHHAHDWQEAFASSYACLKPGGWLVICGEPNLAHTLVSYRVARLSNTHEIGLSRRRMLRSLRGVGFRRIRILKNRMHLYFRSHWLAAQK